MESRDINLRDMLHRAAKWFPNNQAVVDDVHRYTYAQLLDLVGRMAKLLHKCGVRKGDRVALMMYPSSSHVVALFGAWELGAIPCALHLRESPAILTAVLERLSPRVLVYEAGLDGLVAELRHRVPFITAGIRAVSELTSPAARQQPGADPLIPDALADYQLDFEPMPIAPDDTAVIVLSSGTTAIPKGIMHTHRTMIESARGGAYIWNATPYSTMTNVSTTAFIGWYNTAIPFFNAAAKVVFLAQWDPQRYLEKLQEERVTIVLLVPTMWRMLFRHDVSRYDLSSVRRAYYAGEPMDTTTMRLIREKICPQIMNQYGTTETGSCAGGTIMFTEDYADPRKMESVGKPFMNADVRVIRPGGTARDEMPRGEEGEVIIRGPSVASQVWEQPDVARKIFEGPWWHSGDMGVIDQDNYLTLRGRIDDMIISGGINVFPSQVEEAVLSHPAVAECAVIGLPDEQWGQRITAFVVAKKPVTAEELAAHVARTDLSHYKRPREYRFLHELPRGATGKINRRMLRQEISRAP